MIEESLRLVFQTMQKHRVKALLMGGQACVLYGAAEFSKDIDFVVLADSGNLGRIRDAMKSLEATRIAVPPFEQKYLTMGLAVHFRAHAPGMNGLRIDIMTKMRGVDDFPTLWKRRKSLKDAEGNSLELLSIPDLVRAKKTQRSKDWPMIQRLMEVDYLSKKGTPGSNAEAEFWLSELRTPELLIEAAASFPDLCESLKNFRPLLKHASAANISLLEQELTMEMLAEKQADRVFWEPLKIELEKLRIDARNKN